MILIPALLFIIFGICIAGELDEMKFEASLSEFATKSIEQNDLKSLKILLTFRTSFRHFLNRSHYVKATVESNELILIALLQQKRAKYRISEFSLIEKAMAAERRAPVLVVLVAVSQIKGAMVPQWDTGIYEEENWHNGISHEFACKTAVASDYMNLNIKHGQSVKMYIKDSLKNGKWSAPAVSKPYTDNSNELRAYLHNSLMEVVSTGNVQMAKKLVVSLAMKPYLLEAQLEALRLKNYALVEVLCIHVSPSANRYKAARYATELQLPGYIVSLCLFGQQKPLIEAIRKTIQLGLFNVLTYLSKYYQPPAICEEPYDERTGLYKKLSKYATASSDYLDLIRESMVSPRKSRVLSFLLRESGPFVEGVAPFTKMSKYFELIRFANMNQNKNVRNNLIVLALRAHKNLPFEANLDFELPILATLLNSCIFIGDALRNVPGMNYDVSHLILDNLCNSMIMVGSKLGEADLFRDMVIYTDENELLDPPEISSSSSSGEDEPYFVENLRFGIRLSIQGIYKENMNLY